MPGVYREKNCPTCGIAHKKRGPYCSRSCGNIREHTQETKEILREKTAEYYNSPEGIATRKKLSEKATAMNTDTPYDMLSPDDYAIDIPDVSQVRTMKPNEFSDGHDIWFTDDDDRF